MGLSLKHDCFLHSLVQKNVKKVAWGSLPYFDVSILEHLELFQTSFLKHLVSHKEVNVKSALDDLKINSQTKPSLFVKNLNTEFASILKTRKKLAIMNYGIITKLLNVDSVFIKYYNNVIIEKLLMQYLIF